jgi:hypothetical protein
MLKKDIKKVILETKERKEKLLIEQKIVTNRVMMVFESKENIVNFKRLPKEKKQKIANALFEEISYMEEQGLLNEQLWDFLKSIFGNSLGAATETFVEPLINSVFGAIGLGDSFFSKFVVSFLTTNPSRIAQALKSCDELTKLIAESLTEAVAMMIMKQQGLEGKGYAFLRNALGGAVRSTSFASSLENQLSSVVCSLFHKMNDKASNVVDKLKGDSTENSGGGISGLIDAGKKALTPSPVPAT